MIKNKQTIKKTFTNLGEDKILGVESELFEVEAYQSQSGKSFGYIATCVRTGRSFGSEFRGKYVKQDFEKENSQIH